MELLCNSFFVHRELEDLKVQKAAPSELGKSFKESSEAVVEERCERKEAGQIQAREETEDAVSDKDEADVGRTESGEDDSGPEEAPEEKETKSGGKKR